MDIGDRIKKLREGLCLTMEQVGKQLGVNKSTMLRYENNEIDIKRTTAIQLAKILLTTPTYIMGWSDNPKDNSGIKVDGSISDSQLYNANYGSSISVAGKQISKQALELVELYESLDLLRQHKLIGFALELKGGMDAEKR